MIDPDIWLILANRLDEIKAARELLEEVNLEFDEYDQAKVVKGEK